MLALLGQIAFLHDDALRIYARRHVLVGDAHLLQHLQEPPAEADLAVHQVPGKQHLVGLLVAEADVVALAVQGDAAAVLVEGVHIFAP